ncbi:formate-dependent phosphoribosylglycinamide formyltransferase [Candidatus Methylopumilus universalis]|uniref:Formate-dependent phosphoribosylglycinamide formyltransferase n=1 Tax=Candidatus Methylopumilus universalis TaxID=2588536 RepID=A0AAX1EZL7_9PROT|nr:formate-dependent phosphoribosylglycinamide formyltransferase [Candidatus Methylopumilus universalis]QDC41278.1 formate-dependent phosphoribosylglycinamide formyltransferase [Candidatus Methylopumilus universalis]QDC42561.1 formate-dependent phosphoribosylglycinamide formyltransferase [Candidatus Methylopumilus universalis]QDC54947.1 formate-dependent phosphoribosylglycinamide formyltransferase [Candidatus Methylopumilus universalis]QDC56228.1 formate-dependent phosphoribosylglycinamide form
MNIGTPLSPNATRVMLLGSGELGKEAIIALQRLGVEVIAVDRYENAPGHQVAHRSHVIDMTDGEALLNLVKSEKPHYIVPEIEAINTDVLAHIEKSGDAIIIPTVNAVQLTMNREGIRDLAANQLRLPTSPFAFAKSLEELQKAIDSGIGYPCFVKPTMSSSGKGQSRITEASKVKDAWDYAASAGRVNKGVVIVEGQIDFDYEITLLTVRAKNEKGDIETYFCEPIGHKQEQGDYVESWQPQPMHEVALKKAREIAKKITDALGGLGLFGVELFIKDDQVWFSEVSPRPHDTGMVTMASQRQNEFELHARAILGLPVNTSLLRPSASAVIYGNHDADGIYFENIDKALAVPESDLRLFGKPTSFKRRRMGVALASADNVSEARARAQKVSSLVKTSV